MNADPIHTRKIATGAVRANRDARALTHKGQNPVKEIIIDAQYSSIARIEFVHPDGYRLIPHVARLPIATVDDLAVKWFNGRGIPGLEEIAGTRVPADQEAYGYSGLGEVKIRDIVLFAVPDECAELVFFNESGEPQSPSAATLPVETLDEVFEAWLDMRAPQLA